jgi:hypothetical protein
VLYFVHYALVAEMDQAGDCNPSYVGSSPIECFIEKENQMKKLSKSDFNEPGDIQLSDATKITALQAEVKYWRMKYETLVANPTWS